MRPNILLITADQWRGDWLGALGFPVQTPALDALAAEGTLFARHYAPCAPCSPARASLHNGLYQMNHRVVWNGAGLDARFDTLALAARRAGYLPTLFGYTDTAPDPRHVAPRDPARRTFEGVLPGFHLRQGLRPGAAWRAPRRGRGAAGRPGAADGPDAGLPRGLGLAGRGLPGRLGRSSLPPAG
ncbi:MAG: sulfatase-like hydrolase/transferase [Rhodosalinus sp.]